MTADPFQGTGTPQLRIAACHLVLGLSSLPAAYREFHDHPRETLEARVIQVLNHQGPELVMQGLEPWNLRGSNNGRGATANNSDGIG